MTLLSFQVVDRSDAAATSPRDRGTIDRLVSWQQVPHFQKPGRTAWQPLEDPVRVAGDGPTLQAAKLKGVGAWNPPTPGQRSSVKGRHPAGLHPPSSDEYEDTAGTVHFGIDHQGGFRGVHGEAAPFGAILLRRARQEHENARRLCEAGVPSVHPWLLCRYEGLEFRGEPLGAVVTLSPTASPLGLDVLYQPAPSDDSGQRRHLDQVMAALGLAADPGAAARATAQARIAWRIGRSLRRFAQAGLYRYSAAWDNFYFDPRSADVVMTDLDSSRPLSELQPGIAGLQVLRDLAGALWRLPKQLCEPEVLAEFPLEPVLAADALAATLAGFLDIDEQEARSIVAPLWEHVVPGWFLLKRQAEAARGWSRAALKSHRIDRDFFCCLALQAVAGAYAARRGALGLPPAPDEAEIAARVRAFLGEQAEHVQWLLHRRAAAAA